MLKVSAETEFGSSENAVASEISTITRQWFCLHLAVIGLRDPELRKRMIAKTDLTWDMLKTSLNALTKASESDHKLSKAAAAADVTVKQEPREVAVVYERRNRGSSSERSYKKLRRKRILSKIFSCKEKTR